MPRNGKAAKTKSIKTKEQILKANLNKTLNKLKIKVAEKEELWLDLFQTILPCMISYETNISDSTYKAKIGLVCLMTDEALSMYENRWCSPTIRS